MHGGQTPRAGELERAGSVRLGLQEEAEQEELLVGFGEEGVWHLGRWEALQAGGAAGGTGIAPFDDPLPGFPPSEPSMPSHSNPPQPYIRVSVRVTCPHLPELRGGDLCPNHLLPDAARPVCLLQLRHHGRLCGPVRCSHGGHHWRCAGEGTKGTERAWALETHRSRQQSGLHKFLIWISLEISED